MMPPDEPMKGVGDVVAKVTTFLGFKTCGGCQKRREALNDLLPFTIQSRPPKVAGGLPPPSAVIQRRLGPDERPPTKETP